MFGFIAYIAGVLRFLLPWFNAYLAEKGIWPNELIAHSLSDCYPMIVAYMAFCTDALIVGSIQGFMLVDE
jgi:hypothetical protein